MKSLSREIYDYAFSNATNLVNDDMFLKVNKSFLKIFKNIARNEIIDLGLEEEKIEDRAKFLFTIKIVADIIKELGWTKDELLTLENISDDILEDEINDLIKCGFVYHDKFVPFKINMIY